jgi:hypothetical protein
VANRIGGVMVSMLTSSAVDRGFEPDRVKHKTIKLVCVAFPLSTRHLGERAKTGWFGIRMCPSERHIYPRTVVSVNYHYKNPTTCGGLVQSGPHHHFIEN